MDIYNEFAHIYDELMFDFDYEMWADYIVKIFDRYDKKPDNILEMACGTGNLTEELVKKGYKITGFDISQEMLSVAYEKLKRDSRVRLLNLDMVDFNLNQKFDAVLSVCDSVNYILREDDLLKTFKNVYEHLEDDGIFIFDINSSYKLKNIIGNNTFVYDQEDIFYTWENFYDLEEDICDFILTFFIQDKENNMYVRFNEEHSEKAYEIDTILKLLKGAGFKDIEYYEGFTFDKVENDTERINFIAKK